MVSSSPQERKRRNNRISKKWEKDPYNISEKFTNGYEILSYPGWEWVGKNISTSTGCLPPHHWLNSRIGIINIKTIELGNKIEFVSTESSSTSLSIPLEVLIRHHQETQSISSIKRIIIPTDMREEGEISDSIELA
ncbi:hypothetical protein Tco_0084415 [Tanacetum coccineum]